MKTIVALVVEGEKMTDDYEQVLEDVLQNLRSYSSENFMINYVDLLTSVSDAPVEFHLAASLFVLSTMTAQRFAFASAVDSPLFTEKDDDTLKGRKLNLWFLIFGKSRITRKTSALMKKIDEIMTELDIHKVTKVWSAPHLITQLSKMKENNSVHAVWVLDECSLFFSLISKNNTYLAEAEATLSTLYDGDDYTSGTQARGSEFVPKPNFCVLLASTENLPSKFKKDAF